MTDALQMLSTRVFQYFVQARFQYSWYTLKSTRTKKPPERFQVYFFSKVRPWTINVYNVMSEKVASRVYKYMFYYMAYIFLSIPSADYAYYFTRFYYTTRVLHYFRFYQSNESTYTWFVVWVDKFLKYFYYLLI